jgi:hypothetical protein
MMTNLQIIRDCMKKLTYSEMMTMAEWFGNIDFNMNEINDASYWAYRLNDWAENAEFPEDGSE